MFETQIAEGMKILDEVVPGWESRIELARLRMASPTCCILGQLFGHYLDVTEDLVAMVIRARGRTMKEFGFELPPWEIESEWRREAEWDRLTNEWAVAIGHRRSLVVV